MMTMGTPRPLGAQEQLVFVHIPKTAGTTLVQALQRQFAPDDICPAYFHHELAALPREAFAHYRLFRGHFFRSALEQLLPRPARYMTFLREPVDRALSNYAHVQNYPDPSNVLWGAGMDLEEQVLLPHAIDGILNFQVRFLAASISVTEPADLMNALSRHGQEAFFGKWPSAAEAQDVLERMPFFGLTERFDESLALLAYTFGWQPFASAGTLNAAPRRPTREHLPQHVLERIVELNEEDVALYQFACRLFDERLAAMVRDLTTRAALPQGSAQPAHGDVT